MENYLIGAAIMLAVVALIFAAIRLTPIESKIAKAAETVEEDALMAAAKAVQGGLAIIERAHTAKLHAAAVATQEAASIAYLHDKTKAAVASLPTLTPPAQ